MFLNYLALGLLIMGVTLVFYGFIYIHDIPHELAKKHNHPQVEAIHVACWLSLFTLHAIWPIVFIWAIMKPRPVEVVLSETAALGLDGLHEQPGRDGLHKQIEQMSARLAELERESAFSKVQQES